MNSAAWEILNDDHLSSHLTQDRILAGGGPDKVAIAGLVAEVGVFERSRVARWVVLLNDVHEDGLHGVTGEEGSDRVENSLKVSVEVDKSIVDVKPIIFVPAPDVKGTHAHHHLVIEGVTLCLKSISPGSSAHAGVGSNDGELSDGNSIV